MTNEERLSQYMNRNIKLYPTYLSLTWDVFFFWSISTLFYSTYKGVGLSQCVLIESLYMLFICLFAIPVSKIFTRVRPIVSSRIAGLGVMMFIALNVVGKSFIVFVLAQAFLAFANTIHSVKDNSILTESLTLVERDKDYQRFYGKGVSIYYVLEAIGAVVATYLFAVHPCLPFLLAFVIVCVAEIISFFFVDPVKFQKKNVDITVTEQTKQRVKTPDGYLKILSSGFVISLLVYMFFFRGLISMDTGGFRIFLQGLTGSGKIPVWAFGCIYGVMRLCNGVFSKYQFKFSLKFGVRSILIINGLTIGCYILNGLLALFFPNSWIAIIVIIISSCILCSLRVPNQIFVNNYLQVCMPSKNIERLFAFRTMVEGLGYALMGMLFSALLSVFNDSYALTNLAFVGILALPTVIAMLVFIRALCKKYAQKYTIIKDELED